MAGNGPLMMLATLKEHLPRISAGIVLWFYYEGNDLVDLQTERKSALLASYLRSDFSQPDLARQRDIDRAIVAEMPRLAAIAAENAAKLVRNTIRHRLTAFVKLTSVRDRLAPIVDTDPDAIEAAADFERANMKIFRDILLQAKGASRLRGRVSCISCISRNGPVTHATPPKARPNATTSSSWSAAWRFRSSTSTRCSGRTATHCRCFRSAHPATTRPTAIGWSQTRFVVVLLE